MQVPQFYVIGTPHSGQALICARRRGWIASGSREGLARGGMLNGMVLLTHPKAPFPVLVARRDETERLLGMQAGCGTGYSYVAMVPDRTNAERWPIVRELLDAIEEAAQRSQLAAYAVGSPDGAPGPGLA